MRLRAAIPACLWLLAWPFPTAAQVASPRAEPIDVLDGVDPVLLLRGRELPGKEGLSAVHRGYRYLFTTPETKAEFEQDPSRYEPRYGGTCARMGLRTGGRPGLFAVHQGRIYLFGSDNCVRLFQASPDAYLDREAVTPSYRADARARGADRLDRAAQAVGGPARLDSLSGWRVELTRQRPSPGGPTTYPQHLTVVLPDRVRDEQRPRFGTLITVDTPADTFGIFIGPDGTPFPDDRPPAQREALALDVRRELARSLLSVLRSRRAPEVTVADVGPGRAGDLPVETVAVHSPLGSVTLGIDPKTGRVLTEAYRGRDAEGRFGEIVLAFSDYRDLDGWTLPFAAHATFDGQPSPALGWTVTAWTLDPEIPPSLFVRPTPPVKINGAGSRD